MVRRNSRPMELYKGFNRLNEVSSPEELKNNELQEAINITYDEAGGVSKRYGIEKVNKDVFAETPITCLINYSKKNKILVGVGTKLLDLDGDEIKDGQTEVTFDNTDFSYDIFSDGKLYLVNGNKYYVYDGDDIKEVPEHNNVSLDHVKRCKYIVQRGERMFAAGDSQHPNSIYYSEIGQPNHFPATNVINAISDDNDIITGLAEFHQAMVAFKNNHIYAWFGWDPEKDVRFDKVNVHAGAVSHKTIKRVYNFLYYMGRDGVYALTGLEPDYISSNSITDTAIKRRFASIADKDKAVAEFFDGKYLLSVTTEANQENDLVLVFDYVAGAWAVWEGWNASALLADNDILYLGSSKTGQVYQNTTSYDDDGEAIHFKITTKPFDLKYPLHDKKFSWFHLLAGEGSKHNEIDVTVHCDYKSIQLHNGIQLNIVRVPGASFFDEVVPSGRTRLYYMRAKLLARSMRVQVSVENSEVDEAITIYGLGFQFWPIAK